MRVEPLVIDEVPLAPPAPADGGGFAAAIDALGQTLAGAQRAEDAFAYGSGSLQEAIYERTRADVALSAATASAQRLAQSLSSILNMQI